MGQYGLINYTLTDKNYILNSSPSDYFGFISKKTQCSECSNCRENGSCRSWSRDTTDPNNVWASYSQYGLINFNLTYKNYILNSSPSDYFGFISKKRNVPNVLIVERTGAEVEVEILQISTSLYTNEYFVYQKISYLTSHFSFLISIWYTKSESSASQR